MTRSARPRPSPDDAPDDAKDSRPPAPQMIPAADLVRVIRSDDQLAAVSEAALSFDGRPAALILAFLSPHVDFAGTCARLAERARGAPVLAVTTAGLLAEIPGDPAPLYLPTPDDWPSVVIQSFSPDLIAAVSLHGVALHSHDDSRPDHYRPKSERIRRLSESLATITPPFDLDSADTLALTFIDGQSLAESYFMEAVYRSSIFPCLFIGGSTGCIPGRSPCLIFNNGAVVADQAVIAFVKMAPGKRYAVLKSQNFRKLDRHMIVLEADPDHRTVCSVVDPEHFTIRPVIDHVAAMIGCPPDELAGHLPRYSFGIELDGDIFVRSVAAVDHDRGCLSFFCDVNTGDKLYLLEATDLFAQTAADYQAFLADKPPPVGAILNDCILRRLNNPLAIIDNPPLWHCPSAGFSTFGELFGMNVNQTLTAIFFFDVAADQPFRDPFLDRFPVYYARFQTYFTLLKLARMELLVELRSRAVNQLTDRFADMANLSEEVEAMAAHARRERALRDRQSRLQAITASLYEGVLLVDISGRIMFANPSAEQLLGQAHLPLLDLDDVMRLIRDDQPQNFSAGAFSAVIARKAPSLAEDAFVLLGDGRRLNIAYAAAPLDEGQGRQSVVISFRSIETLKAAQHQALQSSRLASIGQLAAGIAHEINTPIQYVGDNLKFISDSFAALAEATQALADLARQNGQGEQAAEIMERFDAEGLISEIPLATQQSLEGIHHVAQIVKSMKDFSHPGTGHKVPTNINSCIENTIIISRNQWKDVATLTTDLAADLPLIPAYPTDINQLLLNLVVNSAQAIAETRTRPGPKGQITITTRRDGEMVEIRVSDDGPGIPPAIADRIFDPFFTTKPVGKGTGQGLAICRDAVVNKHQGSITLDQTAERGASFIIRLPVETQS